MTEEANRLEPCPLDTIGGTLAFFASVIKSGEPWTETCERGYEAARRALADTRATQEGPTDAFHLTCPKCEQAIDLIPSANPVDTVGAEGVERDAVIAYLRFQDERGVERALENEKGTTRRAAFGGGALALSRAADAIEAGKHLEFSVICIGCSKPIGSKPYAVDVNGETGCPACFTEDGSGECWNEAALRAQPIEPDGLAGELSKLARKATAEPWAVDTLKSEGEYGSGPDTSVGFEVSAIYDANGLALFDALNSDAITVQEDYPDEDGYALAYDEVSAANAALIVALRNNLPAILAALSRQPVEADGWRLVDENAPHACCVMAARLDTDAGEWVYGVVASPPSKPFTHWRPLPDPPALEPRSKTDEG